jgi:type I site-specific restriction endonuclease
MPVATGAVSMSPGGRSGPEQIARQRIDDSLAEAGWVVQDRAGQNIAAGLGVAVREFPTDSGPCDYLLFLKGKPAGIIEAKREGEVLTSFEAQTGDYATKLPSWLHPPVRPCGLATAHDRIARSPSPRGATYLVTE